MRVETPSGLIGTVRKLKGAEVNLLSDRRAVRQGTAVGDVLSACWNSTEDPGPYAGGEIDWNKALACDRFFTLVCIRMATYGSDFVFKTRCGETGRKEAGCGARFEWEIDLKRDLPYYELPEESREKIKAGDNRFETILETDDGEIPILFKLNTGADEIKAAKKARQRRKRQRGRAVDDAVTIAIAGRILKFGDLTRTDAISEALEAVDFDAQLALLDKMDESDGGFDTKIEIECPECGNVYEINLPFEGEGFWTPRKRSRKSASPTKKTGRVARTISEREEMGESS